MVRNFRQMNGFPFNPIRSWLNSTGPRDTHLITAAIIIDNGTNTGSAASVNTTSRIRFHAGTVAGATAAAAGITVVGCFTATNGTNQAALLRHPDLSLPGLHVLHRIAGIHNA